MESSTYTLKQMFDEKNAQQVKTETYTMGSRTDSGASVQCDHNFRSENMANNWRTSRSGADPDRSSLNKVLTKESIMVTELRISPGKRRSLNVQSA